MENKNQIYERRNADGSLDYIVNLGNVVYNTEIITLSNIRIPLWGQPFFKLPEDKNKYLLVNVYYKVEDGSFYFEHHTKSDKPIGPLSFAAIENLLPIAQISFKQYLSKYEVSAIYEYSRMSTFSFSTQFEQGDRGLRGPLGVTGSAGTTGIQGDAGVTGLVGITGSMGDTGLGVQGYTGLQGVTGVSQDLALTLYTKFKVNDPVLIDYSVYERDFGWTAYGAGFIGNPGGGATFIKLDESQYLLEEGVVDNCHAFKYNGGGSSFVRGSYTGFEGVTGVIHAWVRVDMYPVADFTYTVDPLNPLKINFLDQSKFFPDTWEWDIEGSGFFGSKDVTVIFAASGKYMVTLKATNSAGYTEKTMHITV